MWNTVLWTYEHSVHCIWFLEKRLFYIYQWWERTVERVVGLVLARVVNVDRLLGGDGPILLLVISGLLQPLQQQHHVTHMHANRPMKTPNPVSRPTIMSSEKVSLRICRNNLETIIMCLKLCGAFLREHYFLLFNQWQWGFHSLWHSQISLAREFNFNFRHIDNIM